MKGNMEGHTISDKTEDMHCKVHRTTCDKRANYATIHRAISGRLSGSLQQCRQSESAAALYARISSDCGQNIILPLLPIELKIVLRQLSVGRH